MPSEAEIAGYYPHSDSVHGLAHVLRVLHLAEQIAMAEGADVEIVRAAALLHDAEAPLADSDAARRAAHHLGSAELAGELLRQEGWAEERIGQVQHCIRAHRFRDEREPPQTLEAQALFDADKLDAIGAIGAARAVAFATQAGQPFYAAPSEKFVETGKGEPGEPHSAYHEYLFKLAKIPARLFTVTGKQMAERRLRVMRAFFEALAEEMEGRA